jgi:tRNA(adenine34) deaminase
MSNLPPKDERSPPHADEPGSAITEDIHGGDDAAARGPAHESSASQAIDPRDELFMRAALAEAEAAGAAGDVPVGAVVVGPGGTIIARGRNRREQDQDPTAHAEVDALRLAARQAGAWRLEGATVYATLEPCPMCAGALVNARVARVVYGCTDPKAGAIDTLFAIGRDVRLNHRFEVASGVLAVECAALLRAFFASRRGKPAVGAPNR